jgi:hypothetical protein
MLGSADLLITVVREGGQTYLRLQVVGSTREISLPINSSVERKLEAWRAKLPSRLESFHKAIGKLQERRKEERGEVISEVVSELRNTSLDFQHALAITPSKTDELQTFTKLAIPYPPVLPQVPTRILLTVPKESPFMSLPIEYLTIGRPPETPNVISDALLLQELSYYAGFCAIVAHQCVQRANSDNVLRSSGTGGRLPIKIIRNKQFYAESGKEEVSEVLWLQRQRSRCVTEPLWPDDDCGPKLAQELLAACLWDPHRALEPAEARRAFSDQIQHISCHYHHDKDPPALTLREQSGTIDEISINVDQLRRDIDDLRYRNEIVSRENVERGPGPIVFLNACASGATSPGNLASLVDILLLYTGSRAVLATEAEIHFPFAARFARRVYRHLLDGKSLGLAVYFARLDLVRSDCNPVGILYTIYGDPDLHVPADSLRQAQAESREKAHLGL